MLEPSERLRKAIIEGNLSITTRLLRRFPDLIDNIDPSNGWNNLHYASYYGHYLIVSKLIKLINNQEFHYSHHHHHHHHQHSNLYYKSTEPNKNQEDSDEDEDDYNSGDTHTAADTREVKLTFKHNTYLHLAVLNDHEQTLHLLLQQYPNLINFKGEHNQTPLSLAAKLGFNGCLQLLLDLGADCNCVDDEGNTPLHLVLQNGNLKCIKTLIYHNVKDDIKNKNGWLPIDLSNSFETEKYYVQVKANFVDSSSVRSLNSPDPTFYSTANYAQSFNNPMTPVLANPLLTTPTASSITKFSSPTTATSSGFNYINNGNNGNNIATNQNNFHTNNTNGGNTTSTTNNNGGVVSRLHSNSLPPLPSVTTSRRYSSSAANSPAVASNFKNDSSASLNSSGSKVTHSPITPFIFNSQAVFPNQNNSFSIDSDRSTTIRDDRSRSNTYSMISSHRSSLSSSKSLRSPASDAIIDQFSSIVSAPSTPTANVSYKKILSKLPTNGTPNIEANSSHADDDSMIIQNNNSSAHDRKSSLPTFPKMFKVKNSLERSGSSSSSAHNSHISARTFGLKTNSSIGGSRDIQASDDSAKNNSSMGIKSQPPRVRKMKSGSILGMRTSLEDIPFDDENTFKESFNSDNNPDDFSVSRDDQFTIPPSSMSTIKTNNISNADNESDDSGGEILDAGITQYGGTVAHSPNRNNHSEQGLSAPGTDLASLMSSTGSSLAKTFKKFKIGEYNSSNNEGNAAPDGKNEKAHNIEIGNYASKNSSNNNSTGILNIPIRGNTLKREA
ncbi:hypothetical protein PACTADRAFT_50672 [Pachysolen tannophilus NRRL Y-2460]|uniref:Uncharacterized protein n=1 Tax=Pachysolen tannophilus NRRL Y-2460 TaxID=669874 RepID=A0A1E4TST0_PACTA|nr:hypothetical protein PACTADRAFT_50672 [Pachysolen tannophilus NRRL Y-2460]